MLTRHQMKLNHKVFSTSKIESGEAHTEVVVEGYTALNGMRESVGSWSTRPQNGVTTRTKFRK